MRYRMLFLLVCCANILLAQNNPHVIGEYPTQERAVVLNTDSILGVIENHNLSLDNNYISSGEGFMDLMKFHGRFNAALVFNPSGAQMMLYEGKKCVNYGMVLQHMDYKNLKVDNGVSLNYLLSKCDLITTQNTNATYPTVLIFWGMVTGIKTDDNSLEWEALVSKKFQNKVNIIKVNMDASTTWSKREQDINLGFLNQVLAQIKQSMN